MVENTNILGLVTFSIVLGVAIAITSSPNYSDSEYGPRPGLPVLRFFRSLTVVMMKVGGVCLTLNTLIFNVLLAADHLDHLPYTSWSLLPHRWADPRHEGPEQ